MLKIPLSGKVFKEGRPCYKGGRNVCNQNGAYGRNSLMVCKHAGKCADIVEHTYRCVLLTLSSLQLLNFYVLQFELRQQLAWFIKILSKLHHRLTRERKQQWRTMMVYPDNISMIRTNYYAHYNDENLNLTSNWCA